MGEEFQINVKSHSHEYGPHIVALDNGFVVTWTSYAQDGSGYGVFARKFDNNGTGISGEFQVNSKTQEDQYPRNIVKLENNNFVIIWDDGREGSTSFNVKAQIFDPDCKKVGSELQVNTNTNGKQWVGKAVSFPNRFIVAWYDGDNTYNGQDGSKLGVYAQIFDNNGSKLGTEFRVNDNTEGSQHLQSINFINGDIVINYFDDNVKKSYVKIYDTKGNIKLEDTEIANNPGSLYHNGDKNIMVWSSQVTSGDVRDSAIDVYFQQYDISINNAEDIIPLSNMFQVNDREQISKFTGLSISSSTDNKFTAVWSDYEEANSGVFGQTFDNNRNKIGNKFKINSDGSKFEYPKIDYLNNNDFAVVWEAENGKRNIEAQIFDNQNNKIGSQIRVNNIQSVREQWPAVTRINNAGFVVVWADEYNGTHDTKMQIFDDKYQKINSQFMVNTYTGSYQITTGQTPITNLKNGNIVAVWSSNFQDGSVDGIYGQILTSTGNKVGAEFKIHDVNLRQDHAASVTSLSNNNFVVTWIAGPHGGRDHLSNKGIILSKIFTIDGMQLFGEFQISNSYANSLPAVSAIENNFVVVWPDCHRPNNLCEIHARIVQNDGKKIGAEFVINKENHSLTAPVIDSLDSNKFVILWKSSKDEEISLDGQIFTAIRLPNPISNSFTVEIVKEGVIKFSSNVNYYNTNLSIEFVSLPTKGLIELLGEEVNLGKQYSINDLYYITNQKCDQKYDDYVDYKLINEHGLESIVSQVTIIGNPWNCAAPVANHFLDVVKGKDLVGFKYHVNDSQDKTEDIKIKIVGIPKYGFLLTDSSANITENSVHDITKIYYDPDKAKCNETYKDIFYYKAVDSHGVESQVSQVIVESQAFCTNNVTLPMPPKNSESSSASNSSSNSTENSVIISHDIKLLIVGGAIATVSIVAACGFYFIYRKCCSKNDLKNLGSSELTATPNNMDYPNVGNALSVGSGKIEIMENKKLPIGIKLSDEEQIEIISLENSMVRFKYDNGIVKTSWIGAKDAVLIYDFNKNKIVEDYRKFVISSWSENNLNSDFDALLEVSDTDNNRIFDSNDKEFNKFALWQDKNQNGVVDDGEFQYLEDAGIKNIDFSNRYIVEKELDDGNHQYILGEAVVNFMDGSQTTAYDIAFLHE